MSRRSILIRYFLKDAWSNIFTSEDKKKKIFLGLFMAFCLFLVSIPLVFLVISTYDELKAMNLDVMLISLVLVCNVIVLMFFGTYSVLNIFYFSNDIEIFLPMPIKSSDIVIGKFSALYVNLLMNSSIIILPLIAFGVKDGAGILYYIYMIIVFFISPILPMVLVSILAMLLMRFGKLTKHKDGLKMVGGCLTLVFAIAINIISQNSSDNSQIINLVAEGDESIIGKISGFFITNKFSANALAFNMEAKGVYNILLAVLVGILVIGILYAVGGKLYLNSVIGISETYSRRKDILSDNDIRGKFKKRTVFSSLVRRDIKNILRTPQFFINAIAMQVYMPIIFGVAFLSNGNYKSISKFINSLGVNSTIFAIVFLMVSFFIATGGAGISAISREGKDITIARYIPIEASEQLKAKFYSSLIINNITVLIILIFLIILDIGLEILLPAIIVAETTVILVTIIGMYTDYRKPNLDWDDEKNMMKNNFMPMLIWIIMIVLSALFFIVSLYIKSAIVMFILMEIITFIICWMLYNRLIGLADKVYNYK
ncbi:hypothetical protein KQI77_12755 [Clostridium sp. MSJ-8]|uniref:putative ABC transporter permease subunit n=1 Tax=Clostridium sp. MSJ-8 TaxID=2841510 RepID=UPI001C0E98E8|nr:hypothetical protein [Clostridium sp. MSJ-8]MBU5488996.1 hypothetical protein [Clostridium sp. MSJ-8]